MLAQSSVFDESDTTFQLKAYPLLKKAKQCLIRVKR